MNKYLKIYCVYLFTGAIVWICMFVFQDDVLSRSNLRETNYRHLRELEFDEFDEIDEFNNTQTLLSGGINCNHGVVVYNDDTASYSCKCDECYINYDGNHCSYKKKSQLITFLLSFLIGEFGADWFYLARGNAGYIIAGVFKLLTVGCVGIWWFVDWIRVLNGTFSDGNHRALCPF